MQPFVYIIKYLKQVTLQVCFSTSFSLHANHSNHKLKIHLYMNFIFSTYSKKFFEQIIEILHFRYTYVAGLRHHLDQNHHLPLLLQLQISSLCSRTQ